MNNTDRAFINPEIEILDISKEDIIATSGGPVFKGKDDGMGDSIYFGEGE